MPFVFCLAGDEERNRVPNNPVAGLFYGGYQLRFPYTLS